MIHRTGKTRSLARLGALGVAAAMFLTAFSGCAVTRPLAKLPGMRQVSQTVSGVSRGIQGYSKKVVAEAKQKTNAVSKDVARFTTKLPGTRTHSVEEADLRSIAKYRQEKAYKDSRKQYEITHGALPKDAQIMTSNGR